MKRPALSANPALHSIRDSLRGHGYWLLPALVALLLMVGSLSPDSFFMHLDTPTLHQNAADLVLGGCWGPSGKPLISLILALAYLIGGPDPAWEMLLEMILATVQMAAFARLAFCLVGSRRWALLASLYFLSLPFVLFFLRMHMVFPLAFFTIGLLLHIEGKHGWAGVLFGITPLTHAGFLILLVAWLGATFLFAARRGVRAALRSYARMALGIAIPILALELTRFLFMGQPLAWTRGLVGVVQRHSDNIYPTDWRQAFAIIGAGDGWINAVILLIASMAYPLIRRRDQPYLDAIYLSTWPVLVAFTIWTGFFHRELIPHLLTGLYPLLAILSAVTIRRALATIQERWSLRVNGMMAVMALGVAGALIIHTLDAAAGSHTAYPQIEAAMARADREDRPVRYFGNFHVGFFYGLTEGIPTGINEKSTDWITADTQAVLIFENGIEENHRMLDALLSDPAFDLDAYDVTTIPGHYTVWRPFLADWGRAGTEKLLAIARRPGVRSPDVPTGSVTILWARHPSGEFKAREEIDQIIYFYPGQGCITPRRFGDQNYYHILSEKAVILWDELRAGRIGEMFRLIAQWIRE